MMCGVSGVCVLSGGCIKDLWHKMRNGLIHAVICWSTL